MKTIYLAAYHQSRFGKLGAATVPEMLEAAVAGAGDPCLCEDHQRHRERDGEQGE